MLRKYLSSFILIVGLANLATSQQVRPLPNPIINIQCGQLSLLRHTGLVPPAANQQVPTTCTYRINVISGFICQMRLDFRQFSISGPTVHPTRAYQSCNDDYLQVGNVTLCGENTGQHIYVPINPRLGERQLTITINTRNGNGNGNGVRPNWNIAVHQFECPLGQSRSLKAVDSAQRRALNPTPRTLVSDWLAPAGCLQYFVEPTGQIDSFNFNNGAGPYIGDMNYAICFRRQRGNRSIKLISTFFRMNTGNPPNPNDLANPGGEGLDIDCVAQTRTPGRSEDFLFIPNAETEETPPVRARLFCGQSLNSRSVISSPAGPFSLTFNSDQVYSPADEIGFRMQYEIV